MLLSTCALLQVSEGATTVLYDLDEALIGFGAALEAADYEGAAGLLDALELTTETGEGCHGWRAPCIAMCPWCEHWAATAAVVASNCMLSNARCLTHLHGRWRGWVHACCYRGFELHAARHGRIIVLMLRICVCLLQRRSGGSWQMLRWLQARRWWLSAAMLP
jgi:hypothetical protein